jgi:hypothetical protein
MINVSKEMQDLSTKNYKILMILIKQNINKWRDISCLWIGRLNIVKIAIQ